MARGNQRDKAREKNLKEQAGKVSLCFAAAWPTQICADNEDRKARTPYVPPSCVSRWRFCILHRQKLRNSEVCMLETDAYRCPELSSRRPRRTPLPSCALSRLPVRSFCIFALALHALIRQTRRVVTADVCSVGCADKSQPRKERPPVENKMPNAQAISAHQRLQCVRQLDARKPLESA